VVTKRRQEVARAENVRGSPCLGDSHNASARAVGSCLESKLTVQNESGRLWLLMDFQAHWQAVVDLDDVDHARSDRSEFLLECEVLALCWTMGRDGQLTRWA